MSEQVKVTAHQCQYKASNKLHDQVVGLSARLFETAIDDVHSASRSQVQLTMFPLSWLYVLSSMLLLRSVLSAPTCELSLKARDTALEKRAVPSGPRFVIYSDKWVSGETGPPSVDQLTVRFHLYE